LAATALGAHMAKQVCTQGIELQWVVHKGFTARAWANELGCRVLGERV
jgi:hypothetical protein